jgi:hypothetical protein
MKIRLSIILILAVSLTLASCNLPVDENALSTAVAATMAVSESGDPKDADSPDTTAAVDEDPAPIPPSDTSEPVSPGVLTVAYTNAGNVWYYQEGGSPIQLTSSGNTEQVVITQDGQWVAFLWHNTSTDVYELRVVQTATSTESVLLTQADLDAFYPLDGALHQVPYQFEFIPGTHTLLMNTRRTFEGPGLVLNNDLWSIEADSGVRTPLLTPGLGGDFYLSPSGSKIALTQANTIGFANSDGTARSPDHLTFSPVITYSEYQYYPVAVWAPDESAIAVVIPPEDPFVSDTAQVFRLPISGGSTHLVDLIGFNFFRNQQRTPLISPDLSRVAFMRETAPNNYDLVVTPLDGSPETVHASGDITWQAWNPDSTRMVHREIPLNYMLVGPGLTPAGLGFGMYLRWVDVDTYFFLDTLTSTRRFGVATLPGAPFEIDVIAGQIFDYDFTQ